MHFCIECQLQWLQLFIEHRSVFWNIFFLFINFFDTKYFIFLLLPTIWLGISWKLGCRFFYLLLLSLLINTALKTLLHIPRPFYYLPNINMISMSSFSFPSGGAQTSALIAGFVLFLTTSFWKKCVGISFAFIVGVSRLYLGVHYPMDVIGGWLIGITLTGGYIRLIPKIESWLFFHNIPKCLAWVSVVLSMLLYLFPNVNYAKFTTAVVMGSLCIFIVYSYQLAPRQPHCLLEKIYRTLLGIFGVFFLHFVLHRHLLIHLPKIINEILTTASIIVWTILCMPFFLKYLEKRSVLKTQSHQK
jgi:membrane-associated phospholipid phosphatase